MKIVAIDLDNVLCSSNEEWINFANKKMNLNCNKLDDLKIAMNYKTYRETKYAFRISGIKANLPLMQGARELTKKLKENGYTIIIMTARPIYEIPKVFEDTLIWLKNNNIQYDLIFGGSKDKHLKILKYFPNMEFIIEDNHAIANAIANFGYKVYLLDNIYNRSSINENVYRIKKLSEINEGRWF